MLKHCLYGLGGQFNMAIICNDHPFSISVPLILCCVREKEKYMKIGAHCMLLNIHHKGAKKICPAHHIRPILSRSFRADCLLHGTRNVYN